MPFTMKISEGNTPVLPTCDQKNGNLNEVNELITNDDAIN